MNNQILNHQIAVMMKVIWELHNKFKLKMRFLLQKILLQLAQTVKTDMIESLQLISQPTLMIFSWDQWLVTTLRKEPTRMVAQMAFSGCLRPPPQLPLKKFLLHTSNLREMPSINIWIHTGLNHGDTLM